MVSTRRNRSSAQARQTVESCPPENRTSAVSKGKAITQSSTTRCLALSCRRCGAITAPLDPPARTAINEAHDQIRENSPSQCAVEERSARDIFPAYPGEMCNHLARLGIKEYEPRLTFVGHPAIGLDAKASLPQDVLYTMKMR